MMDRETQMELIAMGIASPVTKESAGARYHIELSRQLADFLTEPLGRCGGMMTLPDVYCLYNRWARPVDIFFEGHARFAL